MSEGRFVVVAEDDPVDRMMFEEELRSSGFMYLMLPSESAMIEYLRNGFSKPDLIVLDLHETTDRGLFRIEEIAFLMGVPLVVFTISQKQEALRSYADYASSILAEEEGLSEFVDLLRNLFSMRLRRSKRMHWADLPLDDEPCLPGLNQAGAEWMC